MLCKNQLHEKAQVGECKTCRNVAQVRYRGLRAKVLRHDASLLLIRAHALLIDATNEVLRIVGQDTPQGQDRIRINAVIQGALRQIWKLQSEDHQAQEVHEQGLQGLEFEPIKSKPTRDKPPIKSLHEKRRVTK